MLQLSSLQFLEDLKNNNTREWFYDNQKRYETYKTNYHEIIKELLLLLTPHEPSLQEVEVKHCTFRIHRDIRFSKNKTPYKTHMGVWIPLSLHQKNTPGFYLHIEKDNTFLGGGFWNPEAEDLKKIRKEIAFFYEDLEHIIENKEFKREFNYFNTDENSILKTVPKGYEKTHPAIEFLKLKSFTASQKIDEHQLLEPTFIKDVVQKMLILQPLNHFLLRALHTE